MSFTDRLTRLHERASSRARPLAAFVLMLALAPAGLWAQPAAAQGSQGSQGSIWAGILTAAKKEGKVVLYAAPPPPIVQRIADGFKQAHPDIALEFTRGSSGPLISKVDQERAAGADGADVLVSTETSWYVSRAKEGKLLKPAGPAAAGWPARFIAQGTVVTGDIQFITIGYNKQLVSSPPRGYGDLLKPEYKGKLGTSTLASSLVVAWYDWLEKTQGGDFLVKMKEQRPKTYVGPVPIAQALASGEIAVGAFTGPSNMKPVMALGAPVDFVVTNPVLAYPYDMAAFGWSKRPNAALVLLDYLMSRQGQTVWHSLEDGASPLPGIAGSLELPANLVFWNAAAWPPEAVSKYRERWEKVFK